MLRRRKLHFEETIRVIAAPTQVIAAFFDPGALAVWWQAVRSVTTPRPLGVYAIEWETTPFQDEVLGSLGGVFHGTVMEFRKLPRQVDTAKGDCTGGFSLGRNVRGGTRPRLSCGRSWL